MAKLLTIETGFTCNSRCQYCTQLDYRVIPQADQLDLSTEQIRQRIAFAAKEGYDQIGFSGGEPTIRPDFLDLIAYAKSLDFDQIGVTTNGRMFAYPAFADRAVRAGLDSFTFSLHGPTPEIHDEITAAPGALQQALTGLDNLNQAAKRHGVRLRLMNNQILLPSNTAQIAEMVALLAPRGVRLFMIQPFITQRSNVEDLGRFYVPYSDVVASVERALPLLRQYGARIKPYNVPNCLLTPLGRDVVEPQFYGITVFREYEQERAGEYKAWKVEQWYRVDACKTCQEVCPGFRIEQLPQDEMQQRVVQAYAKLAAERPRRADDGPMVVGGTELLEPQTVARTFHSLAAQHGPVAWLTAACERSTRTQLAALSADLYESGALAELVLLAQPMDQRFLAQRVLEKGNLEALRQLLFQLAALRRAGRKLPPIRLFLDHTDWLRLHDDPVVSGHLAPLRKALTAAGGDDVGLYLAASNFSRDAAVPDVQRQREANLERFGRIARLAEEAGLHAQWMTLEDARGLHGERATAMAVFEAQAAEVLPVVSWARQLVRHPLCSATMDFVSWFPPWLFERPGMAPVRAHAQPGDAPLPGPEAEQGAQRSASVASLHGKRQPTERRLGAARWQRQGVVAAPSAAEPET